MDCNCIRGEGNFLFKIEYFNKDFFLYQDLSNWNTDGKYKVPEFYTITITPPNAKTGYDIKVNTKCFTKVTKEDFNGNLIDGIYCVKFDNCENTYTAYFALTNKLDCCLEIMKLEDNENWQMLSNLLEKIKIATKFGDFKLAKDLISSANEIGEQNSCNC